MILRHFFGHVLGTAERDLAKKLAETEVMKRVAGEVYSLLNGTPRPPPPEKPPTKYDPTDPRTFHLKDEHEAQMRLENEKLQKLIGQVSIAKVAVEKAADTLITDLRQVTKELIQKK